MIDMATLPLMIHSFLSDTLHAPVPDPDKTDGNNSKKLYAAYLQRTATIQAYAGPKPIMELTFIEFARIYKLASCNEDGTYTVRLRISGRGKHATKNSTAIGVRFAWELLDIYVGQFCAMFIVHNSKSEFVTTKKVPDGAKWLSGALESKAVSAALQKSIRNGETAEGTNVFNFLVNKMLSDLTLRGAKEERRKTFRFRMEAMLLLLRACEKGEVDAEDWSANKATELPHRHWSCEQDLFLKTVEHGLSHADANEEGDRFLFLSGEPGSGKTEVVIYAAAKAAMTGAKVLIGCPTGALVTTYRERLPTLESIVVETIHSAFAIRRKADAATHDAPSRLRNFDLFIIDEVSQVPDDVFKLLLMSVLEMPHKPYMCLAGDFSQLQPVTTKEKKRNKTILQEFTEQIPSVTLKQHEFARTKDPMLMDFLFSVRKKQPTRHMIKTFFADRHLKGPMQQAIATSIALDTEDRQVTWLTVTNDGAATINTSILQQRYGISTESLQAEGYPGDRKAGADMILVKIGIRLRLTRNLDKANGFVNGAIGCVTHILNNKGNVFLLRLSHGSTILVHPIVAEGKTFLPCAYGYAMTIRNLLSIILFRCVYILNIFFRMYFIFFGLLFLRIFVNRMSHSK